MFAAAATRDLSSADDHAAVLDWRIQNLNKVATGGPLPWLPGIPHPIAADPQWGPYLEARSRLVAELANQVRSNAAGEAPTWAAVRRALAPAELIADIQIWRAATQVDPSDPRPTGPPQIGQATRAWQQRLDQRLVAPATHPDWRQMLATEAPSATADPFLPKLEERLGNLTRAGFDATNLIRSAAAAGPLPDDHPAAALWWRILDQLPETPHQDPASRGQSQPPDVWPRPHTSGSHPGRARRRLPRSARAAETSTEHNTKTCLATHRAERPCDSDHPVFGNVRLASHEPDRDQRTAARRGAERGHRRSAERSH
jgi:hypothetical protein